MPRPHPATLDLAAARPLRSIDQTDLLVASAFEHRLAGLLWTRVLEGEIELTDEERTRLEDADLGSWGRNQLLLEVAADVARVCTQLSVGVVFIKGVTTERRWYDRPGERVSMDLDVVVDPGSILRVPQLVEALYPSHPLLPTMDSLIAHKSLQSVDFTHRGLHIDLHLDPLKQEIVWCRHADELFSRTTQLEIGPDRSLRVFDDAISLMLAALHLNKDRFRYLIGYSDVLRILQRSTIDWVWLRSFLNREGLEVPIEQTINVVMETLGGPGVDLGSARQRMRRFIWRLAWRPETRLLGDAGRVRLYYRQFLIPLLARGRAGEGIVQLLRRLLPPPSLLAHYYPRVKGPYLWKLVAGRILLRWQRWKDRRSAPR